MKRKLCLCFFGIWQISILLILPVYVKIGLGILIYINRNNEITLKELIIAI